VGVRVPPPAPGARSGLALNFFPEDGFPHKPFADHRCRRKATASSKFANDRPAGRPTEKKIEAMQVNETVADGLKHEFQVNIPAADIEAKADARLADLKDKVRLNGFRPGKVPVAHLKKICGRSVMAETVEQTIRDTNTQIFTDRGFKLATEPRVTMPTEEKDVEAILTGKADLNYSVAIEVVPPIQLADFKSFNVEKPVAEVTDADIDEAIKRIADQNRPFAAKADGAKAESGDRVTVSFKGTIDGTPFDGGTGEGIQVLIGSNTFIPGFEEQLIDIGKDETRTLKVPFPKNYANAELAGKPAEFETTATLIEAPQEVTIDDEFAKSLGLESLDKLKDAVRGRLAAEFASATRQRVKRHLLDRLDETHRFEAPPSLVDEEFNLMWNSIKAEMDSAGKTFADEDTTEEAAREEYRKIADRRVRLGLVLSEIGEKNKITVTDDEVSRAVIERARQMPGREKEVWDYYRNNASALAQLRAPIYEDKVVDFILELANVTEKRVSREDLYKDEDEKSAA
jgi:trigger factor